MNRRQKFLKLRALVLTENLKIDEVRDMVGEQAIRIESLNRELQKLKRILKAQQTRVLRKSSKQPKCD